MTQARIHCRTTQKQIAEAAPGIISQITQIPVLFCTRRAKRAPNKGARCPGRVESSPESTSGSEAATCKKTGNTPKAAITDACTYGWCQTESDTHHNRLPDQRDRRIMSRLLSASSERRKRGFRYFSLPPPTTAILRVTADRRSYCARERRHPQPHQRQPLLVQLVELHLLRLPLVPRLFLPSLLRVRFLSPQALGEEDGGSVHALRPYGGPTTPATRRPLRHLQARMPGTKAY